MATTSICLLTAVILAMRPVGSLVHLIRCIVLLENSIPLPKQISNRYQSQVIVL